MTLIEREAAAPHCFRNHGRSRAADSGQTCCRCAGFGCGFFHTLTLSIFSGEDHVTLIKRASIKVSPLIGAGLVRLYAQPL
jgi:hypothetical protein